MITARNPRSDATHLLVAGHEARVLEPSMPPSRDPAFYADDPTDPAGASGLVVSPTEDGDLTWDEYTAGHPEVAEYARDHWLGGLRRLQPLPEGFAETRDSLHQVAFFAIAPTRYSATGKLGLRYTHRGFGTPFFGSDEQVRVENGELVVQTGDTVRTVHVTTVGDATRYLGRDYEPAWFEGFHDPLAPVDPEMRLTVNPDAAEALGDWFGFATHVLELARRTPGAVDVSRVQLWPEHFDPAFEMGDGERGKRASYGASPGDEAIPEPYLYVAAWGDIDRSDPFWNAESFNGAFLPLSDLLAADDQVATAFSFLRAGHEALTG